MAEELNLPEVSLQPITDEELRLSQYLSQPPPPQPPKYLSPLDKVYPTENIFIDTSIQTTPQKKLYYIEEQTITDFADGQPIEDICHSLRATNIIETNNIMKNATEKEISDKNTKDSLKFVNTQPEDNYEINSFLLDFKRAKDPITKPSLKLSIGAATTSAAISKSENESSNGSSSEWEFLDN